MPRTSLVRSIGLLMAMLAVAILAFAAAAAADDGYEENDNSLTAAWIDPGVFADLSSEDDDYYKVNLSASDDVRVTVWYETSSAGQGLYLYNSTMVLVDSSTDADGEEMVNGTGLDAGVYYILVDHGTSNSDYHMAVVNMGGVADQWLFLVYLDADNDLESAGDEDVVEMEQVGSGDGLWILALHDRWDSNDTTIKFIRDGDNVSLPIWVVNRSWTDEANMGNASTLIEWYDWCMRSFALSTNVMLDLWDHGGGHWGVCWDDTDGHDNLGVVELGWALNQIEDQHGVIELFGLDACLMAMVEVALEANGTANYFLASEETEPGDGWEYQLFLDDLRNNVTTWNGSHLAQKIIETYMVRYAGYGDVTLSYIDMMNSPDTVAKKVDDLADALMVNISEHNDDVATARGNSQEYHDDDIIDLYDFAWSLFNESANATIDLLCAGVMDAINDTVLYEDHGSALPGSYGLSIYYPDTYSSIYDDFAFTWTDWDELIQAVNGSGVDNDTDDSFEENDDSGSAAEIDFGYYVNLTCADDDWYKVYLTAGDMIGVNIFFDNGSADLDLFLYDPSLLEMNASESYRSWEGLENVASTTGWHYIEVYLYENGTQYEMSVRTDDEFEENDDQGSAAAITAGNRTGLECFDNDYYKVFLWVGEEINATIWFNNTLADIDLSLYDTNGSSLDESESVSGSESVTGTATVTGWYYINVYNYTNATTYDMYIVIDRAYGGSIVVDDDVGWWTDFTSIQDAVYAADNGTTIFVYTGNYSEEVLVNLTVSFVGNGTDMTFVTGWNISDVFNVTGAWVNFTGLNISNGNSSGIIFYYTWNGTVANCNVSNNNRTGIRIEYSDNMTITNSYICNNGDGIFINGTNNTLIQHCTFLNNTGGGGNYNDGVRGKWNVSNLTVFDNYFAKNSYGVDLDSWDELTNFWNIEISYNEMYDHSDEGIWASHLANSSIHNNTFNFNYGGMYLDMSSDLTIANNDVSWGDEGMVFYNCDGLGILNNTVSYNNDVAIFTHGGTGFSYIWWNYIHNNSCSGLNLANGEYIEVINNSLMHNAENGTSLWNVSNTEIAYNEIMNNTGYGVSLFNSSVCMVHNNNFLWNGGNTSQGYDNAFSNQWDNGTHGNWWGDYNGTDSNGDGIGDSPYGIEGTTTADDYPLVNTTNTTAPEKVPELTVLLGSAGMVAMFAIFRRKRRF